MYFQIQERQHRVTWTWQHFAVIAHSSTQGNAGRGFPEQGDAWEELIAALRGLLLFEVREVFL